MSTVMVYQLITPDAVEEKIQELAERKKRLEAIVTQHMGRSQNIAREDVKKALLHGKGNPLLLLRVVSALSYVGSFLTKWCALSDAWFAPATHPVTSLFLRGKQAV